MNEIVQEILKAIENELTIAVQEVMIKNGVKKNSDLVNSVEFENRNGIFVMIANDYYEYVSTGRRPRARKVPINALIDFIKKNRIQGRSRTTGRFISNNSLAFAIQTSIYKNGIQGKNYIQEVENVVGDIIELRMADGLEQILADEIANAFKI